MLKMIFVKDSFYGFVLPLLLIAAGIGLLYGLEGAPPPVIDLPQWNARELMPYMPIAEVQEVRALAEKSEVLELKVNGTVVPYREIELAAEAAGRIIEKDATVRSGNYVSKGQVLFRIDPRDYELEVERLQRKRDQELAAVKELQLDIENSKLILEVAEEELQLADGEVKRLASLGRNIASATELDQAKRSRLTSLNQRVNIQNQIRAQESRRSRLELAAKLAETELSQARLDLERTEIRSPVEGRIVSDQVEEDSYVQRGTPLLVIEDTSKAEVACNIRMDQLYWILDQASISTDQFINAAQATRYELPPTEVEVQYHVSGRDSYVCKWNGVLDRFDGAGLDPQSRTVPIRVRVDHPDQLIMDAESPVDLSGSRMLVRGMYVQATIKAKPSTNLLLVPKLAIKPGSGSSTIWKFSPNPDAMYRTSMAKKAKEAMAGLSAGQTPDKLKQDSPTGQVDTGSQAREGSDGGSRKTFNPDDWIGGDLIVVENVRVVRDYWDRNEKIDYWVCEVPSGELAANDLVVVTPLPKMKGDNTDAIRIPKASVSKEAAKLAGALDGGSRS